MKILKKICFNILIWVVGVAAFTWWLMWDLERNPIPQSPDGSIPDSAGIPIAGFAFFFSNLNFICKCHFMGKAKILSEECDIGPVPLVRS